MLSSTSIISSLYDFFIMESSQKRSISKIKRMENKLNIQLLEEHNQELKLNNNGEELLNNLNRLFNKKSITENNLYNYKNEIMDVYNKLYIKSLKNYSHSIYSDKEKDLIDSYEINKESWEYGVTFNYIKQENIYEVFLYIEYKNTIASSLLTKKYSNKLIAKLYFQYLKLLVNTKNISSLKKIL